MEAITARLAEEYPDTDGGVDGVRLGGIVRPLKEVVVGDYRAMTLTFGGAVAAVLLISVLNLVNLQVSRISRRCREFSIRAALGASRWSLVRQMVVESAILTLSGGALGLGVIYSLRDVVLRNTPALLPRMDAITIDGRVFLFGLSVALISAVIIGVIPVLRASQPDLSDTLKDGTPGIVDSRYQRWLRVTLITAETSLAIVLLLGATLLIQSFNRLSSQELGFDPRDVVTARVALPETYANPAVRNAIFRTILEELRLLDGVESAAAANFLPFEGGIASDNIQTESGDGIPGFIYTVSGRYGSVLRMNPVVGRWITPEEVNRAAPVAVVSESAARSMSFGGNPLGRRVRWLDDTSWLTIVGVVPDVRFNMTGEPFPAVYAPYSTDFSPDAGYQSHGMILAARLSGNETLPLGEFLLRFETDSVVTVNAMDSFIREGPHSAARQRYQTTVLTSFAGVSVALVMLGIHSIVAFSTAQRTREIGLRMALGSTTRGVVAEMMRQSVMAATAGIAVGLCLSTTLTQFLESYLFGIEPGESSAYAIVLLAGVFLILVASWVPARRAAHVDPMVALRYE
jgi:predicted permease